MNTDVNSQTTTTAPTGPLGGPLLFSLAHPDDESFGSGGTIALATSLGVPVTILSATRGERGETAIEGIDSPQTLGAVREEELRRAMAVLGVSDIRILGYWDSGMDGTEANKDPRAFVQADRAEVVTRLVVHIRGLRPAIVVTFAEDGGYGHPDHIAIHYATVEAVRLAADPDYRPELGEPWRIGAFYYTAIPREVMLEFAERNDGPLRHLTPEQRAVLGTPEADISTKIPIGPFLKRKAEAILSHRSQVPDPSRFSTDETDRADHWRMLEYEYFVRVPLPWEDATAPLPDPLQSLASSGSVASSK